MRYIYLLFLLIFILGTCGAAYVGNLLYHEFATTKHTEYNQLHKESVNGVQALSAKIKSLYNVTQTIQHIASQKSSAAEIDTQLTTIMQENKSLVSCSIAFAPYMHDPNTKFFSRRVVRTGDGYITYALEETEDYTTAEWFRKPQRGTPAWSNPFFDTVSKQLAIRYSYPFFMADPITQYEHFGGVANITISLIELNHLIMSMSLDKETYGSLIDEHGIILSHTAEDILNQERNLDTLAREPGKKDLLQVSTLIQHNKEGELTIEDTFQQKLFRIIIKKVPDTPWFLMFMHLEHTNMLNTHLIVRLLILFMLLVCISTLSFITPFFISFLTPQKASWLCAICCSILLTGAIVFIWSLDIMSNIPSAEYSNIVDTELALDRFLFFQKKSNPQIYKKDPHFVPTGIFITALRVSNDASTITIGGQVWQKYDRTKYKNDEPGVVFFNATDQAVEKIYSTEKNAIETVGWRFRATIPVNFNYLKYPFDEQEITISLGHKDYLSNIILVPDLSAFRPDSSSKAEIDPSAENAQWIIKESYPFYQLTDFNTDFGIKGYTQQKGFPHLSFVIHIRRQFVYPLTASALPVIIILFVVFSIVLFTGLATNRTSLATEVIKLTASIFLGAAVAHQTFQRSLQSPVITYFEYFYFLLYAVILITAINGMLYAYNRGGLVVTYGDNFIPRLLYWPVTLCMCLLLTLYFFY